MNVGHSYWGKQLKFAWKYWQVAGWSVGATARAALTWVLSSQLWDRVDG